MVQDAFDQKKQDILRGIYEEGPDASPKGSIDELCIPIMELINGSPDMVTTSSCSGRVSVFIEGAKEGARIGAKGDGGHWLFVTHDEDAVAGWWKGHSFSHQVTELTDTTRYILYKFEPLILHVKCRSREAAERLYTTAMGCGFRESGIGTNNLVGIRISIKLDVPIGWYDDKAEKCHLFMGEEYLEVLAKLSLDRFRENRRKLEQLHQAIAGLLRSEPKKKETPEERARRMREEGLARREEVRLRKQQERELKAKMAGEEATS